MKESSFFLHILCSMDKQWDPTVHHYIQSLRVQHYKDSMRKGMRKYVCVGGVYVCVGIGVGG